MSDNEQENWSKPTDDMVNKSMALTRYTATVARSGTQESSALPNQLPQEFQQQSGFFVPPQGNSVMASPSFLAAQQMMTAQQVMVAQQMLAAPQMRPLTTVPVLKIVELTYADGEKKTALAYDVENVAVPLVSPGPGLQGHAPAFIPVGTNAQEYMGKHYLEVQKQCLDSS